MTTGKVFPICLLVILAVSTLFVIIPNAAAISWYDETWHFRKIITIDNSMVSGSSNLSNFPVLISISNDPDLKSNNIQSDGDDILFTTSDGATKLSHEIESFTNNPTNGALVAWIKIPTLSYDADTVIYMYYGKSDAQSQQTPQNVWDSNYRAVLHLKETGTGAIDDFKDSTSNIYHGKGGDTLLQVPLKTSGKIGNAQDFDGNNDQIEISKNVIDSLTAYTVSFWINPTANTANDMIIGESHSSQRFAIKLSETSPFDMQFIKNNQAVMTSSTPASGTWQHYTLVWDNDGGANNAKLYKDGNLNVQSTTSGTMGSLTGNLVIGGNPQSSNWYDTIIDEVRISNIVRSANWIKTEFNNQNSPSSFYAVSSPTVPSTPTSIFSTAGNGQISLSWSAPSNNGDSPILDYIIEYSSDNGLNWVTFSDGLSTSTSATITGLTNDRVYLFRVSAINSVGSSSASNVLTARPSSNTNFNTYFIAPPLMNNADKATMESKGLSSGFVLPSSSVVASSNFDIHDSSFQYLKFTTSTSAETSISTLISDYAIPQYTKPSNWNDDTVWTVPPAIIPISGNVGETAVYRVDEIAEEKPIFLPFTGAEPLDNGGKLNGMTFTLASGKTANNLNVVSKFLKEPPPGIPEFSEADLYLSFDFSTTENIDFGSTETFAISPVVSFVMGPIGNSVDPNLPTNTVNSNIVCPNVQVPLISGSTPTTSGISVSRDPSGDTSSACGYTATLQHFSDYFARAIASSQSPRSENHCSDCEPPSFMMVSPKDEFPLKINENSYTLQPGNKLTPTSVIVGKPVDLTVRIYENKGPENVEHVGLYTEFQKDGINPAYANTAIAWDKWNGISVYDPDHNIQDYDVTTTALDNKFEATFNITFAKPLGVEDVVIRTWDSRRNSADTTILSAWDIGDVKENKQDLLPAIKKWGGYDIDTISDSELLQTLEIDGESIPSWFKKIAKWVVMKQLGEQEMVNALKYMHDKELLKK